MGPENAPPPALRPNARDSTQSTQSTLEAGLQLGPPGRWWNDKQFARSIGLDSKQQHRLDEVFDANKGTLLTLYKKLKSEESDLEKTTRARVLDEGQIDQQIDRVVQARGALEKANAHMLLQIRSEMTPEQLARLEEHRPQPE